MWFCPGLADYVTVQGFGKSSCLKFHLTCGCVAAPLYGFPKGADMWLIVYLTLSSPSPPPPNTYFYSDRSCHGRVKIPTFPSTEFSLVLRVSVQSGCMQTDITINSASGWCARADVLTEKNKSLLWHLEDFTTHGPQPDHKEISEHGPFAAFHHPPLFQRFAYLLAFSSPVGPALLSPPYLTVPFLAFESSLR